MGLVDGLLAEHSRRIGLFLSSIKSGHLLKQLLVPLLLFNHVLDELHQVWLKDSAVSSEDFVLDFHRPELGLGELRVVLFVALVESIDVLKPLIIVLDELDKLVEQTQQNGG